MDEVFRHIDRLPEGRSTREYVHKISPFPADDTATIADVARSDKLKQHLIDSGLTQGERTGVSKILGKIEHLPTGKGSHDLKVGEVRTMSDQRLSKITSDRGVKVIRALFGQN